MHIKLISSRMSLRPMDSEFKRLMAPSLALLTLGSLTPKRHTVTIEDENVKSLALDDTPDIVGITVNVDTSKRAYRIADRNRKRGVRVILGGIHASACPEEALQHADTVCIGEAEHIWKDIVQDAEKNELKERYYYPQASDMAHTPIPRWELVDRDAYMYTNIMTTSRGCPFLCEFCYNSSSYVHHVFRNRPVKQVIKEIQQLKTRHVMFIDDNFIGNVSWARKLVKAMKPLKLKWNAAVSINIAQHPDLLDEMKESGCQSLFIGFETINQDALRSVRKFQNRTTTYEKVIQEIHKRGIMINASLVFGFDHDKPDVFRHTLDWLVQNKVETMTAHILTPYPGTTLHKQLTEAGRIVDQNPEHYNTAYAVFRPRHMSRKQLVDGYLWIYEEFYSFANILRRFPQSYKQWAPYLLFNLGYRKFGTFFAELAQRFQLMSIVGNVGRRMAYAIE